MLEGEMDKKEKLRLNRCFEKKEELRFEKKEELSQVVVKKMC